jgi:hypothetical protein
VPKIAATEVKEVLSKIAAAEHQSSRGLEALNQGVGEVLVTSAQHLLLYLQFLIISWYSDNC